MGGRPLWGCRRMLPEVGPTRAAGTRPGLCSKVCEFRDYSEACQPSWSRQGLPGRRPQDALPLPQPGVPGEDHRQPRRQRVVPPEGLQLPRPDGLPRAVAENPVGEVWRHGPSLPADAQHVAQPGADPRPPPDGVGRPRARALRPDGAGGHRQQLLGEPHRHEAGQREVRGRLGPLPERGEERRAFRHPGRWPPSGFALRL
mmetsp:Transcript_79458/g.233535  ORF Transcript_79458/g.233535 Transcript_79458/m.233535 type:complete len:201 (-) Transcript_79458:150-752(-)